MPQQNEVVEEIPNEFSNNDDVESPKMQQEEDCPSVQYDEIPVILVEDHPVERQEEKIPIVDHLFERQEEDEKLVITQQEEETQPLIEAPNSLPPEETYRDKVKRLYQYYFDMFNGGIKAPTGNKSYEEYVQWRYWKREYERIEDTD